MNNTLVKQGNVTRVWPQRRTWNVTSDPAERADLFAKAKAFLDEENPLYTIGFTNHLPAWRNYVKGMAMEQRTHTHWGELTTVWMDR